MLYVLWNVRVGQNLLLQISDTPVAAVAPAPAVAATAIGATAAVHSTHYTTRNA